jgi:hypothetical protein
VGQDEDPEMVIHVSSDGHRIVRFGLVTSTAESKQLKEDFDSWICVDKIVSCVENHEKAQHFCSLTTVHTVL